MINKGKLVYKMYVALFQLYVWIPMLVIMLLSFNNSESISLPWKGFTTKWYTTALHNHIFIESLSVSILISAGVTMVSIVVGLLTSRAFVRHDFPGKKVLRVSQFVPVVLPGIVLGISLLILAYKLHIKTGMFLTIFTQATWNITYGTLIIAGRLEKFDYSIEEAALDLGANKLKAMFRVVIPFLFPAIVVTGLYTFINSFNDFNATIFVSGNDTTFPIFMFSTMKRGMTPEINAISIMLAVPLIMIGLLNNYFGRKNKVS